MKYKHSQTQEIWSEGQASTARTSNFYLLSHAEKVALGWVLMPEVTAEPTLEEQKSNKLSMIKTRATDFILATYPVHKQINAVLGIYGTEYKTTMSSFIQSVRQQVSQYEALVDAEDLDFEVLYK